MSFSTQRWLAGRSRDGFARDGQPCAVPWPFVVFDRAVLMVDADGTFLGGVLGTLDLFPGPASDRWEDAIAAAQSLMTGDAP